MRRKVIKFPIQTGPILPRHPDLGDPPDHFDKECRAIWFELCELAPAGVLWRSDHDFMVAMVHTIKDYLFYLQYPEFRGAKSRRKTVNTLLIEMRVSLKDRKRLLAALESKSRQKTAT